MRKVKRLFKKDFYFFVGITLFWSASLLYGSIGSAVVEPDTAMVGEYRTWKVVFTVGEREISQGGAIKIEFPSGWHTSPWPEGKLKKEQFTYPERNHYLKVGISRKNVSAELSVVREGVDGQHDRYGRSFVIRIQKGTLSQGDKVTLSFCNTTAPITSETENIAIAIDAAGTGNFQPIKKFPTLEIVSGEPKEIRVIAPSQAKTGVPINVTVVVLDQFYNAADRYRGIIMITSDDSLAVLPPEYKFTASDEGTKKLPVTFNEPGIHTVKVTGDLYIAPHGIRSNPVDVGEVITSYNIYWGDLHSHSGNSKDGSGNAETAFRYARDVSVLDFYALTDHGAGDVKKDGSLWEGLTPKEWEQNKKLVKQFNKPGKFVTYLACEWSGRAPYGHHNVFFRNLDGQPFGEDNYKSVEEVWEQLKSGNAFTIPHHSGITWPGGSSPYVDWAYRDDKLQPALEIYSLWGSSEFYDNSMSYEHYHQRNFRSHPGKNYAKGAWASGQYIGTIAGSDNHTAHPGKEYGGLTAVLTSELNRDSIFDAILNRHTYATTGQRILLNFMIDGKLMGSKVRIERGKYPEVVVKAAGTDVIDYVQVMKYDGQSWSKLFEVNPGSAQCEFSFTDQGFTKSSLYYVRIKQRNFVGNREVRAWSSPIWVSNSTHPWWENKHR